MKAHFASARLTGIRCLLLSVAFLLPLVAAAATTNDLSSALQQGLFEEEANRNLPAAIAAYEALAKQFDKDRALAATAVFRLGECYRKQGQTNEAAAQYQRILRDFADQQQLATLSRQNLAGMGVPPPAPAASSAPTLSRASRQEQAKLLDEQIKLAEQDASDLKKQFEVGRATQADIRAKEREVLNLRQQLAALDLDSVAEATSASSGGSAADQANLLSAQLSGFEKLKGDPEMQARAVLALYPDEDLKKMLLHLPKIKAQAERFKADPKPKLDSLVLARNPGQAELLPTTAAVLEPADVEAQLKRQLLLIAERVDFILGLQKARLQVLQSVAGASGTPGGAKAGVTTVVIDPEETEIRRLQAMIKNSPDLINAPSGGPDGSFTPLARAANAGQLRVAEFLLDNGADVNTPNSDGRTPLLVAANVGHKAMIELLLKHGADVNAADPKGQTALHLAADRGFVNVTEVLLAAKADPNRRDNGSQRPLTVAAKKGLRPIAALLLAAGADPNVANKVPPGYGANNIENGRTMYGTPLHLAAARGDAAMVSLLLTNRADVKALSLYSETPLQVAAACGKADVAELLLAAGADPNARTSSVEATPLHLAVRAGQKEVVARLLAHGADPNATASEGERETTPLMQAASAGYDDIARLLLEHKADPNLKDGKGNTALIRAINENATAVVKTLLAHGANPDALSDGNYPALIIASAGKRNKDMTAALLAAKANVNSTDSSGSRQSALHYAASSGDREFVQMLLAAHADVNLRDVNGNTPLHLAVREGKEAVVPLLLDAKADPNLRNNFGVTPLDYAKGNQNNNVPRLGMPGTVPPLAYQWRAPGFPGQPPATAPGSREKPLADLLREHGALDDLPDFTAIRVTRQGWDKPIEVFRQQTNGWNHFTLLETVLGFYAEQGLVDFQRAYGVLAGQNWNPAQDFQTRLQNILNRSGSSANTLWFPDLKRVIVHRPSRTPGGKEQAIPVNLLNATNGVDCAKDLPLEFGDVVEIPVRDHALSESPSALSVTETAGFLGCLRRKVTLTVRGQSREIELRPTLAESCLGAALVKPEAKALLLSSSDLSRVKVTRRDSASGKAKEFLLDESKPIPPADDLWLRDGDVIEVPEK